jgi:hypothetical protein
MCLCYLEISKQDEPALLHWKGGRMTCTFCVRPSVCFVRSSMLLHVA